jgi:hypothetical protein
MYRHVYMPTDPRLGRHVQHDPRSLRYAHGVLPKTAIKTVDWTRRAPIFDQGQLGSCTGNAAAGLLGTDSATRPGLTWVHSWTVYRAPTRRTTLAARASASPRHW